MASILGINTSHESSICSMTNGKIDFYHEEARWCRDKHFHPEPNNTGESARWQTLDYAFSDDNPIDYDVVGLVSYDRRMVDVKFGTTVTEEDYTEDSKLLVGDFKPINYLEDRFLFEDIRMHMRDEPMSRERLFAMPETFLRNGDEGDVIIHVNEQVEADLRLNNNLLNNYEVEQYDFLQDEHHLLHAFAGLYQSPFKEALVLVCDGGGAKHFHEVYPNYQEIESIYYLSDQDVEPLYKHLTNSRALGDWNFDCYDGNFFAHQEIFSMDEMCGYDVDLSSRLSEGMKFSQISAVLGFDDQGRAAGKAMGMASYGLEYEWDEYSPAGIAGRLQRDTVDHTANLIQRALDYKPECQNIILSGGYALNCVANYEYLKRFPKINFFIDPAAHDGGTAIGSCVKNHFYKGLEKA